MAFEHTRSFNGIPSQLKPYIIRDFPIYQKLKMNIKNTSNQTFNRRHKKVTHSCIRIVFTGSPEGLQCATNWMRAAINVWLKEISPPFLPQPLSGVFVGVDNTLQVDWRTAIGM